jgi:hypothetical protein
MKLRKLLKNKYLIASCAVLLASCGEGDFNYGKVGNIIKATPVNLDGEYVTLTSGQIDCGADNDLWDPPFDTGSRDHKIARLKQAGRDLKFGDDVSIGDKSQPYVQIRGTFTLVPIDISSDKDGPDANTRLVSVKLGVPISHKCFPDPLFLMGVRKGNFVPDTYPQLLFHYDNGWTLDRVYH